MAGPKFRYSSQSLPAILTPKTAIYSLTCSLYQEPVVPAVARAVCHARGIV